jgi:2-iminobutanoate/2-iminopropanoate deaminase
MMKKKTKMLTMKKNSGAACLLVVAVFALAAPAMAQKKIIVPEGTAPAREGAPAPMFSPGVMVGDTLYVAGQLGTDPKTRQIPDAFEDEVKNSIESIGAILKAAGMGYSDVVSVTVYLTDMDLFQKMNGVYGTYFTTPRPVRAAVGVAKLATPKGRIEISVIAAKK